MGRSRENSYALELKLLCEALGHHGVGKADALGEPLEPQSFRNQEIVTDDGQRAELYLGSAPVHNHLPYTRRYLTHVNVSVGDCHRTEKATIGDREITKLAAESRDERELADKVAKRIAQLVATLGKKLVSA